MRTTTLLLASLLAMPAAAQNCGSWTVDGITVPRQCPKILDSELKAFAEMRTQAGGALPDYMLDYWSRRLELARQYDEGKITAEAYGAARKVQDEMAQAQAETAAQRAREEYMATQARIAAQREAQREAAEEQRRRAALGLAAQLLAGRPNPAPSYGGAAIGGPAFYKGEQTQGFNKICFYDRVGSPVAITIAATDLCPLSLP